MLTAGTDGAVGEGVERVTSEAGCPACAVARGVDAEVHVCPAGHRWVGVPEDAATGLVAALWRAVQALEDDAAALAYDAASQADDPEAAAGRRERAAAAGAAAAALRRHAQDLSRDRRPADEDERVAVGVRGSAPPGAGSATAALPTHVQVVTADGGVAIRCALCGQTCPVPEDVTAGEVVQSFAGLHPRHTGTCPPWPA